MRVRAFTLIEIIVVIILIGVIFSLVLSNFTSTSRKNSLLKMKDLPLYIKKMYPKVDSTLYMYGENCDKSVISLNNDSYIETPTFGFRKENTILNINISQDFRKVTFLETRIDKKKENICFKLDFHNGRFFDKFIMTSKNTYYLFSPFYQEIKTFKTLEDAQKAYKNNALYPNSIDEYYHE